VLQKKFCEAWALTRWSLPLLWLFPKREVDTTLQAREVSQANRSVSGPKVPRHWSGLSCVVIDTWLCNT
jgi:hypothetical protein